MNKKALYECIMKNVAKEAKKTLNENEDRNWDLPDSFDPGSYSRYSTILGINTDAEMITWWEDEEVETWTSEFGMPQEDVDAILALKPGQSYDTDGGINIYVRIK